MWVGPHWNGCRAHCWWDTCWQWRQGDLGANIVIGGIWTGGRENTLDVADVAKAWENISSWSLSILTCVPGGKCCAEGGNSCGRDVGDDGVAVVDEWEDWAVLERLQLQPHFCHWWANPVL
eukprot:8425791-Ditylum_brightwellii.AAC.1